MRKVYWLEDRIGDKEIRSETLPVTDEINNESERCKMTDPKKIRTIYWVEDNKIWCADALFIDEETNLRLIKLVNTKRVLKECPTREEAEEFLEELCKKISTTN